MSRLRMPTVKFGRVLYFALAGMFALAIWGYISSSEDEVSWTEHDATGLCHFLASHQADAAAVAAGADSEQYRQLKGEALGAARNVPWGVLNKMHRDLPDVFRDDYQRSLELIVENAGNGSAATLEAARQRHADWVDWFEANRGDILIPENALASCRPRATQ